MTELDEQDYTRIDMLKGLLEYLDHNLKGDLRILKRIDNFMKKCDYNPKVIKQMLSLAEAGTKGSIRSNKSYNLTEGDLRFLVGTHVKKEGGLLPILPILTALAAAGITGLAAKRIYNNHKLLQEEKAKHGGILPLLALLPLIFGGLGAAGAVAGGVATAVGKANEKRAQDEAAIRDANFKQQQLDLMKQSAQGSGITDDVKTFFDGIIPSVKSTVENSFRKIGKYFNITEKKDGEGLYLEIRPNIGSGIFLPKNYNGNGYDLRRV